MELKYATVLVVDDEPMLLDIFREWLEEERCRVLTAGAGEAALKILSNHYVEVIVGCAGHLRQAFARKTDFHLTLLRRADLFL